MRKTIIRIIGGLCILIALLGLGKISVGGLFVASVGYNAFILVMGIMAFMAADLGPIARRTFDFSFGLVLVLLCAGSAAAWLHGGSDVRLGTILFNGIAAVLVLFGGGELPDKMEGDDANVGPTVWS